MKKKKKAEEAGQADQSGGQGQQPEEKKRTVPENLLYWMRTLYRESPGFVWLYLAGCGVAVGISLLGVYMPSVLVADITEGGSVRSILGDLAVLGGAGMPVPFEQLAGADKGDSWQPDRTETGPAGCGSGPGDELR